MHMCWGYTNLSKVNKLISNPQTESDACLPPFLSEAIALSLHSQASLYAMFLMLTPKFHKTLTLMNHGVRLHTCGVCVCALHSPAAKGAMLVLVGFIFKPSCSLLLTPPLGSPHNSSFPRRAIFPVLTVLGGGQS